MKNCPRCASEISKYMKTCPRCGLPVNQMEEFAERFNLSINSDQNSEDSSAENSQVSKSKAELKKEKKLAKKAEKKAKKERELKSDTDFKKFAEENSDNLYKDTDTFSERKRKRKNRLARPMFDVDENGELNIDTSDVEIVGEETGKIIEERFEQSYSVKKQRGDYRPPKIKWWEIYKFSDRYFARRKIKKEVSKAAKIKPSFISKPKLLFLALFFGWTGAHNFYAKNTRKGWVSVITLLLWIGVFALGKYIEFFQKIQISVAGFAGFVCFSIWVIDTVNIIFNKFKYRIQIDKFISEMNVETRAKLGEKYIDLELYHKPWWFRFKVWCANQKKNAEARKRDRRQAAIDRQKRKLKEQEEKDKIDRELYEFEQKENQGLEVKKKAEAEGEYNKEAVLLNKNETAKKHTAGENINNKNNMAEGTISVKKKGSAIPVKKYAKTVKNTKAANKKKKK